MKQTVQFSDFYDAFQRIRPNNFSYEGLQALFEYLEQYEEDTGEELELDVIALCCDFSEYTAEEFQQEYGDDELDDNELLEWLQDQTIVIPVDYDTVIVQAF